MSVYIKGMELPVDCLACRIACDKENYGVIGRPPKCPLVETTDGDLISRADAIEAAQAIIGNEASSKAWAILEQIRSLPSAEAVPLCDDCTRCTVKALNRPSAEAIQGWIPCNERLPNYREAVLVSTFWGVRMAERDSVKEDGTDDFWYLFLDDATAQPMYVYAWMPLPTPYKSGDSDD